MAEKTSNTKYKIWVWIVLVFLLVALPATSWLYLHKGLKWRRDAQEELKGEYGKILPVTVIYSDGSKENLLAQKVCVIHYFGANPDLTRENKFILDTGEKLFRQFGYKSASHPDYFRMVMISQGGSAEFRTYARNLPSANYSNWVWTGGLNSWRATLVNAYTAYCQQNDVKPVRYYYALADTSGTIRRFYNALDEKEVGRMVEHIALLLPRK
ncbi:MAG: hypothetical protein NZM43_00455 [Saprospiraceae bacterium]|nr:hypothetical protein [Saprospiraceae bacterium]MDW8482772.1 hypothetical protein [Saprospiraceae bacterium]